MITLALVGALLGVVVVFLLGRLLPARPSPLVQLGQFDARSRVPMAGPSGAAGWTRLGQLLTAELSRHGISCTRLRQDVALTGQGVDEVMARKVLSAAAGFLLSLFTLVGLQLISGLPIPLAAPFPLAVGVAGAFFFLPDLEVRREAVLRRDDFRRALGAYLDLVALEMAGDAAPAQALSSAAKVGAGWPMALLRDTLSRARLAGRDQWAALTELGERIGVAELRDLGSLVRLVEHDGARVRQTLSARAATMRRRELADAEGKAAERDMSMSLAQLVVGFGFFVFLSYPAVVNVMGF